MPIFEADDGTRPAGEVTVLVDARNVLRSRWPNIGEQELVDLCSSWAKRNGVCAVVVFDGEAPSGLTGERHSSPQCVLVGSGSETADEWLVRTATECEERGRPYWLVTSDRALRAVAGRGAERIVGGGSFARHVTEGDRGGDH